MKNENILCCICGKCKKVFILTEEEEVKNEKTYIHIDSCVSGGVYSIYVNCPHCGNNHQLMGL